jgi:(heptosyl)LPS beta-1,4-glucosyltransferase
MPQPLPISGVVITKNEADRIVRCVASLRSLCAEVLVLDSGSSDDTVARATAAGARVVHQDWLGFAAQKNAVIAMASQPWVLLLDADEWLDVRAEGVLRTLFSGQRIESADVWRLHRRTHFLGKALNFGGWGRESVDRLFRPDLRYLPAQVHERLDLHGKRVARVAARIEHDTARNADEYRNKLDRYARLFAEQRLAAGEACRHVFAPWTHAGFYLLKNFVVRGGFLDGQRGWQYHALHARYVWKKYRQMRVLAKQL